MTPVCKRVAENRKWRVAAGVVAICGAAMSVPSNAQCTNTWSDQFAFSGTYANFGDAITWDDGNGPAIYVAGYTTFLSVGNIPFEYVSSQEPITIGGCKHIAKWDGEKWSTVGSETYQELDAINALVHARALEAFDPDGPGPMREMLVMAGRGSPYVAPHLAVMFDGTQWQRMGSGGSGEIYDLQLFNGELYAAGKFTVAGGENLAKWDVNQQDWVAVGGGVPSFGSTSFRVERMAVGDVDADGSPELYFCGVFGVVGENVVGANQLAKWNGTEFSAIPGFQGAVTVNPQYTGPTMLKVVDMGDGPSLLLGNVKYAGMTGPRVALAKYRAGVWSTLVGNARLGTSGAYGLPFDACMFGPVGNQKLHIAGTLLLEGLDPASSSTAIMRRRDDGSWEQLARNTQGGSQGQIHWMRPVDWDLSGPGGQKLLVGAYGSVRGGNMATLSDIQPNSIALINDTTAEVIHTGSDDLGVSGAMTVTELDIDGAGPEPARVFFSATGGKPNGQPLQSGVFSFDGTGYTQWGTGMFGCRGMLVATLPGSGPTWYAINTEDPNIGQGGGHVRRWTGTGWETFGYSGMINEDLASLFNNICVYQSNGQQNLLVSGTFNQMEGQPALWVSKWDGTSWTNMNAGLPVYAPSPNLSLSFYAGLPNLVVVNNTPFLMVNYTYFDSTTSSNLPLSNNVYRYNGTAWELIPNITNVTKLQVLDLGSGEQLFALGRMNLPEVGLTYIALWNGTSFEPYGPQFTFDLPNATASEVGNIGVHDFGDGPQAVISMMSAAYTSGDEVKGLVRLHNGQWQNVDGGARFSGNLDMHSCSLPGLEGLFLAGVSRSSASNLAGGFESHGVAWLKQSCTPTCPADFNTSGSVTVQDIFDFLSAWFAGTPSADFNHVGGVTVQDIFDFLGAWFAGC